MNIASFLAAVADPDRPALIFPSSQKSVVTFRELDELSSRLAAGLFDIGVRMNSRVILLAPISLNLYLSLIALFKLGGTAVFLDPHARRRQLDQAAAQAEARAFIGTRNAMWLRLLSPALRRIPILIPVEGGTSKSLDRLIKAHPPRSTICEVEPATPALITFTGGSTNSDGPRGVMRTHRLLAAQHASIARSLPSRMDDIDMPSFPIVTLHNLAEGITSVIPDFPIRRPQAMRPERVLRQISTHGVTTASGTPAFWRPISEYCIAQNLALPLRRILLGGAPVMPELIERLSRVAPGAEILGVYGSTEAEPVALMPAKDILADNSGDIANGAGVPLGYPVSDICVKIWNMKCEEQPAGATGEIWVSGEHVARSYFASPQADAMNKRPDSDGRIWHRMGDLGYKDRAGRLWLMGRLNTVIERDGHLLYPEPVEAVAEKLPYIHHAGLVGVPDGRLGEKAILLVEWKRGMVKPAGWQAQIKALCARHGWPLDGVYSIRRLPVDPRHNARIDYLRLKVIARKYR